MQDERETYEFKGREKWRETGAGGAHSPYLFSHTRQPSRDGAPRRSTVFSQFCRLVLQFSLPKLRSLSNSVLIKMNEKSAKA